MQTTIAQLAIWTKKFAPPFERVIGTNLQKISASDKGELILSVYKPQDDKSSVILSMKKGESGIFLTHNKPVTLKQPNSFVQITRKYLQNRRVSTAYATISPICIIIEFALPNNPDVEKEVVEGPNALILDLDEKPPRLILGKKYAKIPDRYQAQCQSHFQERDIFFESWCEWSEENTKTKRRASFLHPLIGYCPLLENSEKCCIAPTVKQRDDNQTIPDTQDNILFNLNTALSYLPTHIRRHARTKLQFLERRLSRQKQDLPTDAQLERLKKQSEGLKTLLYLWPKDSLIWYAPPQFIEQYSLNPIYTIRHGEKPSSILSNIFHEIDVLERRKMELSKRINESELSLLHFEKIVIQSAEELKKEVNLYLDNMYPKVTSRDIEKKAIDFVISRKQIFALIQLCKILDIKAVESEQIKKSKQEKEQRLPYRNYATSTGQFIRVARSAADGDQMIKQMPSNHYWLHVLTGEGSHVWLEKLKKEKKLSQSALREAAILAIHYSKHSKSQEAEVQFTTRADIEKKKNLPPGKVLVRRCETFLIRYNEAELKKIIEDK